ncbi:MAG TPA: DUF362 domain-containing protein [Candidatus Nealsonbacteria bacterium]|uniref:DUF362 domain-containing protein n=1 Tax=marine sediment metagenome TaxID=412755 RepID=A0A0F9VCA7_9ZZZZ|nr:DUF362 domain-containing protein [Candidatus Nealsonbacteria bacterium]HEB46802.1 DUF362 domain-containing protein [Candidatus Nealsonbacteria bacterium]
MEKVSKVKIGDDLKKSILESVNSIGGFKRFIKPGEVVLLKPNFNTTDPFPASSDPEFIKAVVELVYDCGVKIVMIGDSATMSLNTRKVMEKLKIFDLEKMKRPPRIYVFEERKWVNKKIPGGKYLKNVSVTEFLDRADKLIFLPNLKTHSYAEFTGSLKLSVGFMKPIQRIRLHTRHLQEKVAELNKIINPDLVIMDARKCFITKGPAEGEVREPGLILASTDRVAIDVEGIKIIQSFNGNSLKDIDPWELPQIKRAIEIGISVKT